MFFAEKFITTMERVVLGAAIGLLGVVGVVGVAAVYDANRDRMLRTLQV